MVESGTSHYWMDILHSFMRTLSILGPVPWIASLLELLPVAKDVQRFEDFSRDCFEKRRSQGSSRKDIFYHLLAEDKETGSKLSEHELIIDARTGIVGGSDTTAITFGCVFFYLTLHQDKYRKLREEVLSYTGQPDNHWLGSLPYLNAVIHEALRLMPPVPQALQRVTPPGGVYIGDVFVPGNTLVGVSPWTIHRDVRYFSQPDEFIPERWLDNSSETCTREAWIPFSVGNYACIGKQLAFSELRHVTTAIVRNFDMQFAPNFDPAGFEKSVKNDFTMTPPCVIVELKPREQ